MSREWFDAIADGNIQKLEELDATVDIDVLDERGSTGLMLAAASGNLDMVKWFIAHGADLNFVSDAGFTVPFSAAFGRGGGGGHPEVLDAVLGASSGADNFAHTLQTVLALAIGHGAKEVVPVVLRHGADPNLGRAGGPPPLHLAAAKGRTEIALALIKAGADTSAKNEAGATAADVARQRGFADLAETLGAPA
jgi:ankyrin repeat protein